MSKKCTPLWRTAHFEVKMLKRHHVRTTFGSCDVEKVHAVVARSTFGSQNVKNTRGSDHFWRFRCQKKCTPLWREAHFEVKMLKTLGVRTTFGGSDVEKVHAVVARSTFRSQNIKNTTGSDHFWRFRCGFASLHYITLHYTPQHYNYNYTTTQLHYNYNYNYTTTQLHSTTLHYSKLHYTTLHYTTLHYTTLHYTTQPSTTLHYITLHYTTLHNTTTTTTTTQLHSTTLNYTTLHYITLHYTTFHYTSLHYTTLRSTTLQLQLQLHNYTPLH